MPRKRSSSPLPDWALKINKLRVALKLEARPFADLFGVSPATVSYWLTGKKHPSPKIYFRMAQLAASEVEAAPFLKIFAERSGMEGVGMSAFELKKRPSSVRPGGFGHIGGDAVGIPLLKDAAAAGNPRQINEREIAETLPLPRSLCPHPESIVCIRVEGDSMSPLLDAGYIAAVDTSQREYKKLMKRMVAARDPEGGVTIKWLKKSGKSYLLVPQRTSTRHDVVVMAVEGEDPTGWELVGEVIWWIGMPPK